MLVIWMLMADILKSYVDSSDEVILLDPAYYIIFMSLLFC
jgi:hypothetical protein